MSAAPTTDQLVRRLVSCAEPVRPFAAPWRWSLLWQAGAVLLTAVAVWLVGFRPDIQAKLAEPSYLVELGASLVTGVVAGFAVFYVSLPDRSPRPTWAALVPAAAWLATICYRCLGDALRLGGDAWAFETSWYCLYTMLIVSLPLGVMLFTMLHHAGRVRPYRTLMLATLSLSGFCATGLSLFHRIDTGLNVFIWHFGSASLVALIWLGPGASLFRRRLDREARALQRGA